MEKFAQQPPAGARQRRPTSVPTATLSEAPTGSAEGGKAVGEKEGEDGVADGVLVTESVCDNVGVLLQELRVAVGVAGGVIVDVTVGVAELETFSGWPPHGAGDHCSAVSVNSVPKKPLVPPMARIAVGACTSASTEALSVHAATAPGISAPAGEYRAADSSSEGAK